MSEECECLIQTEDGPVRGYIEENVVGKFYKFKGIPYAKPPLGCLRFLPPVPVVPWTKEVDCKNVMPLPLSYTTETDTLHKIAIHGSEDCLYIEVSTPKINPKEPMPVMFWIGSYAYAWVMDNKFDPSFLNKENVVFVRCGFRIGPFGFLSINEFCASGNYGLKDVVLALKWVKRNIQAFGGDPLNVTLFGNGTGGAIVHLMMLSPLANNLFHKAIIQSISSLNPWTLSRNPTQPVLDLANALNIKCRSKSEIVEKLKEVPALDIMRAYQTILENRTGDGGGFDVPFKPCIETDFEGQPAFITKAPMTIIKSGNYNKVPFIIGSNNIEGSVLQFIMEDFYEDFEKYNENVALIVPKSLTGDANVTKNIGQQLLKFYLDGDSALREDTKTTYLLMITDYYFLYYMNKTVTSHTQAAPECPIYYYIMNFVAEWSLPPELHLLNSLGHCAELSLIFGIKSLTDDIYKGSRESVRTRNKVVKMWTNFAKCGNPTPDQNDDLLQITWDPVESPEKVHYLSIGSELTKGRNPFKERMEFWDELHKEYAFLRVLVHFNDLGVTF